MVKALFLDRDGVINEDGGYVHTKEDFIFLPGVFEALRHFRSLGYELFIVTNQSGIGRGYYTKEDFLKLTHWMLKELKNEGIEIRDIFFCPHRPDEECECRKPKPGMFLEAIKKYNIDPKNSWMIGDKRSDIEAAKAAGIAFAIKIPEDAKSLFDTIKIIDERS